MEQTDRRTDGRIALHRRHEDGDDEDEDLKAMLKVLLQKLDRATTDDEVPQPRVYTNLSHSQRPHQQHRNTGMQDVVSHVTLYVLLLFSELFTVIGDISP